MFLQDALDDAPLGAFEVHVVGRVIGARCESGGGTRRKREILVDEAGPRRQDDGAFGGMAQRADVARPVIIGQPRRQRSRHRRHRLVIFARVKPKEIIEQQHHVARAIPQRRQGDFDGIEAEQQIGAKPPFVGQRRCRHVGCRDDPHIEALRPVAAHRRYLALFKRGQQLGLQRQRQIADFIEKQRPAIGGLEPPDAVGPRVGEGALHMAEQFRIEQAFGDRAQIDRQKRLCRAPRPRMDFAGDQFLAGAVFPQDQHIGVGRRHPVDQRHDAVHRRRRADQRVFGACHRGDFADPRFGDARAAPAGTKRRRRRDGGEQAIIVPGFRHEIGGTALHRLHRDADAAMRGDDDDDGSRIDGADRRQCPKAFGTARLAACKVHVEKDDRGVVRRQQCGDRRRIMRNHDAREYRLQQQPRRQRDIGVVVDDQRGGESAALVHVPHPPTRLLPFASC